MPRRMLPLVGSSWFFLVMVTMEEVRDPALSGRISVLTTELTYNQTTAFWRDWPLPSVQLVVANAQCLLNEHRTHATGHALECPAAPGSSNPMDLNDRFFLAKRTRCRTIQISIDHATNACTGTLEYTPYTHDITKARKHWALQTEQQSKFKSRTSQVSRVYTKGPALAPFSKGKGKLLPAGLAVGQFFRAQLLAWEQSHSKPAGIAALLHSPRKQARAQLYKLTGQLAMTDGLVHQSL